MAFLRRFADKTGRVDSQGRLPSSKVPVKVLDSVASSVHFQSTKDLSRTLTQDTKPSPIRTQATHHKSLSDQINFHPYTLNDYKLMQVNHSVELGGLGSEIGSQGWLERKLRCDRQRTYAQNVKIVNANRLAYSQVKLKQRSPEQRRPLVGTGKAAMSRSCDFSRADNADKVKLASLVQSLRARLLA